MTFGSYINKDSKESNGCAPAGFSPDTGLNLYTGVKTAGCVQQRDPDQRLERRRRDVHRGTAADPRDERPSTRIRRQATDGPVLAVGGLQRRRQLAVDYYDRQYGNDETTGSSDFSLSREQGPRQVRRRRASRRRRCRRRRSSAGQFFGDYTGLDASTTPYRSGRTPATPICSSAPARGRRAIPPALCTGVGGNPE